MSILRHLEAHRDLVLDAFRVYLGTGLFFRGLALLVTEGGLQQLVGTTEPGLGLAGLSVYVTAAQNERNASSTPLPAPLPLARRR